MLDEKEGDRYVWLILYAETVEPERLVWTSTWEEGFGEHHKETRATVELKEIDSGTEVTLTHEFFPDKETRDGHAGGWNGGLDKRATKLADS